MSQRKLFLCLATSCIIIVLCCLGNACKVKAATSKKPDIPVITVKASADTKTITVSIAKTKNADGYRVYIKENGDSKYKATKIKKDGTKIRKYTKKDVSEGVYTIYAKAYRNVNGTTYWSSSSQKVVVEISDSVKVPKNGMVFELNDGTKKSWSVGDEPLTIEKQDVRYVYFGSYPQTEVTNTEQIALLRKAAYTSDGIATLDGIQYKRLARTDAYYYNADTDGDGYSFTWGNKEYAYFKVEPIKWCVLSVDNKMYLVSDKGLDCNDYNDEWSDITWEECALRSWLNDDFINAVFSKKEQSYIKASKRKNEDNPLYGTYGGEKTKDKVILLSVSDVINNEFGFSSGEGAEIDRRCSPTDYSKAMGSSFNPNTYAADGNSSGYWVLRTPGSYSRNVAGVMPDGSMDITGFWVCYAPSIIRPALDLDITGIFK